ncbi:hypothetical protein ERO13_D11G034250v2 [Gossypium hirsutum]|nr:hypothetical protein ERO13_D11G034250v2 [Gossypium hirsutum]
MINPRPLSCAARRFIAPFRRLSEPCSRTPMTTEKEQDVRRRGTESKSADVEVRRRWRMREGRGLARAGKRGGVCCGAREILEASRVLH